jgi:hypothetical protein
MLNFIHWMNINISSIVSSGLRFPLLALSSHFIGDAFPWQSWVPSSNDLFIFTCFDSPMTDIFDVALNLKSK